MHVATKVWSGVQDHGESTDGLAVGQLDFEKEHPLGSDAPGPTDECASAQRGRIVLELGEDVSFQLNG